MILYRSYLLSKIMLYDFGESAKTFSGLFHKKHLDKI